MNKLIVNTLATTGLSVVILATIVLIRGSEVFISRAVLSTFAANVLIHLGLQLTKLIDGKYYLIQAVLNITFTSVVLIVFGSIFDWFHATPPWVLVAMAILIHTVALLLDITYIKNEVNTINKLLAMRNNKSETDV